MSDQSTDFRNLPHIYYTLLQCISWYMLQLIKRVSGVRVVESLLIPNFL